jgi:hypothetical protein
VNTWVKNQLRDAWVDSGVHDGRIECSRSPEYALAKAKNTVAKWLWRYNNERPNMAIGGITPIQKLEQAA